MAGGRPTLLTQELLDRARTYLATCIEHYDDMGKLQVELPSIEGLALFLGVGRPTIYKWKDETGEFNEQFIDILEEVLASQAKRLLNQGIAGNYNSTISKLILGKHGYVDQKDITSDGKALPTPILGGEKIT